MGHMQHSCRDDKSELIIGQLHNISFHRLMALINVQ